MLLISDFTYCDRKIHPIICNSSVLHEVERIIVNFAEISITFCIFIDAKYTYYCGNSLLLANDGFGCFRVSENLAANFTHSVRNSRCFIGK